MSAKDDLLNNSKFKARVAKLEANKYCKVFKEPLEFTLEDGNPVYIAVIGINDSYLVVRPTSDHPMGHFDVFWTKSDQFSKAGPFHDAVSTKVLDWVMMHSLDSMTVKVRHGSITILDTAINTLKQKLGQPYFLSLPKLMNACVQGTIREGIQNPFNR